VVFYGIGQWYLTPKSSSRDQNKIPPNSFFEIDFEFMHSYTVKKEYERNGIIAYFSKVENIIVNISTYLL
jgi:hypothetical protein